MTAAEPILKFHDVSKWFGPVIGLNQVSLELGVGITGLVGSNGAGKSTLMRLAGGQSQPSLGQVTVGGMHAWSWQAKRLTGYCPDNDAFFEDMSGRAFVSAMARLCGFDRREGKRRTEAVLERTGMADRADRKIGGYSKGMRQRIKLAQALLNDPRLLILDEPLSGIDPVGRKEMGELFRSLATEDRCLLISSHELEELERLTDCVVILARGRIAANGTVAGIREMLDDHPLSVRIDTSEPRRCAGLLIGTADVVGLDIEASGLTARIRNPGRFFQEFGKLVLRERLTIERLEPLDESTHAVLGYLLGGSGRT